MTYLEPERLALHLQALLVRRAAIRAALESSLQRVLTHSEREDLKRVLGSIDEEMSAIAKRLEELRAAPGANGRG